MRLVRIELSEVSITRSDRNGNTNVRGEVGSLNYRVRPVQAGSNLFNRSAPRDSERGPVERWSTLQAIQESDGLAVYFVVG